MRSTATLLVFIAGIFFAAFTPAQAHQECVSVADLTFDPHDSVEVVHVVFGNQTNNNAKIAFYSLHNTDLSEGTWQAIAHHNPAASVNVRVDYIIQDDDVATKANLIDLATGKFLGFLRLENESAGTITITYPNRTVVAFKLECKEIRD